MDKKDQSTLTWLGFCIICIMLGMLFHFMYDTWDPHIGDRTLYVEHMLNHTNDWMVNPYNDTVSFVAFRHLYYHYYPTANWLLKTYVSRACALKDDSSLNYNNETRLTFCQDACVSVYGNNSEVVFPSNMTVKGWNPFEFKVNT